MDWLFENLKESLKINDIIDNLKGNKNVAIVGQGDEEKLYLAISLCKKMKRKGIFIAQNDYQSRKLFRIVEEFKGFEAFKIKYFPSTEIMFYDHIAQNNEEAYERIKILGDILNNDVNFIITSNEATFKRLQHVNAFELSKIKIDFDTKIDIEKFVENLIILGYERVESVINKGQFAIRGGIIDIFPVNNQYAVRVELFDNEVDSIRKFDIQTQRSIGSVDEFSIYQAREIIFYKSEINEIKQSILNQLNQDISNKIFGNDKTKYDLLKQKIQDDFEKIDNYHYFAGVDKYLKHINKSYSHIIDYFDRNTIVFIDEANKINDKYDNFIFDYYEGYKNYYDKGLLLSSSKEVVFNKSEIISTINNHNVVALSDFEVNFDSINIKKTIQYSSKPVISYKGHIELLITDVNKWQSKNYKVVLTANSNEHLKRIQDVLTDNDIQGIKIIKKQDTILKSQINLLIDDIKFGIEYNLDKLVIITYTNIFGTEKSRKSKNNKNFQKINYFTDIKPGDYIVHYSHGIGKYEGLQQLEVSGAKKDYFKIVFKDNGVLYVPVEQLELIQKYIGAEGKAPKLSKLGGTDWANAKKRVKKSLEEMAGKLLLIYAEREKRKGYSYSEDTVWQNQLEESFPFEETDDQLRSISEIKKDMESEKPMDRLLCGDVGFGKTEVAIRAIFKAIMDSKQVAYLVPTTVLAQQQFINFKKRFENFPVTVDVLSRFRSSGQLRQTVRDIKSGTVDIVIGTHKLLQKDIKFKDLGLLIIDEEQKFGVSHKERIKEIKSNVDVLTLSATPIPRTLHMSLVGIRDISVIEEPPKARMPIRTYVLEHDTDLIKESIERELARNGQVFYLYNKVKTIRTKEDELNKLVPDARIAVGHGQMDENTLEEVMQDFTKHEYDILLCTSIIESGLDISNANTIIVEDADRLGLSQLHQIRGRVGRSNRVAHCYLTYRKNKIITEMAQKRLKAINEFTELGAGFKISMRDLEIRGAGNLLGTEQHGHMESVGYDMYCKLLNQSVNELKGDINVTPQEFDLKIDFNLSAFIPDQYINVENQKINMYKKIAALESITDERDIKEELIDRYGDIPLEVSNLIDIAFIKSIARNQGFGKIEEKSDRIFLYFREGFGFNIEAIGGLISKYKNKIFFNAGNSPYLVYLNNECKKKQDKLKNVKVILQTLEKLNN